MSARPGSTMRALPTLFRVGFAGAVAYRSELVVWILTTNMPLVMLALWSEVAREQKIGRFGEKDFVAYFLATLIVRLLTGSWVVWEMNQDIRQGTLATRLLRPIHPFIAYATDNLAAVPLRGLVAIPIAAVALAWAGAGHLSHDPFAWLVVPFAILGAWAITFAAMVAIGAMGLFWESSLSLFDLWLAGYFVFSGYLVPLSLMPKWMATASWWMPFRYTLAFPVETMLGMYSRAAIVTSLAIEWAWAFAIIGLALLLWRRGLVRYVVYGG